MMNYRNYFVNAFKNCRSITRGTATLLGKGFTAQQSNQMSVDPKEFWNKFYERGYLPWDTKQPSSQLQEYFASNDNSILPKPNSDSLELCCGTGSSSIFLALKGFRSVGIDVVPAAIQEARQIAQRVQLLDAQCKFVEENVFNLPNEGFNFDDVQRMAGSDNYTIIKKDENCKKRFSFIYDCQALHAVRRMGETEEKFYLNLLKNSLEDGGILFLLVANANEPEVAPPVMSESEVRNSFPESEWEYIWMKETRFDETEYYKTLEKCPLAWSVLLRKKISQ